MLLELVTVPLDACIASNDTDAPFWKLLPLMMTVVPPAVVPLVGKRLEIVGARTALTIIFPIISKWPFAFELPDAHSDCVQTKKNVPAVMAVKVPSTSCPFPTLTESMYVSIRIPCPEGDLSPMGTLMWIVTTSP